MKLIDLKRPKKTTAELKKERMGIMPGTEAEGDRYPYGTSLRFDKEEIDKIEILKSIKADAEVKIVAEAFVKMVETTDVSSKSSGSYPRPRKEVQIQITKISIEAKSSKKLDDMDNAEYRQARQTK